ncbi:MAG TPA: acyl-CoA dehydrogenase [Aeromonadales bacterium]|nr:acyl-CoA dehydrogenase [Aeromonadales bacterium]
MHQLINFQDLNFLLYDFLNVESLLQFPRYADHNRQTFDAVIETAEKLAEKYFLPHNAKADENEPEFDGHQVKIIPEVKQAIDEYAAAGFIAARHDYELGGMQLPATIASAFQSYFFSANPGTAGYPFLTTAAANLISNFASETQKQQYLPQLLSGKFFGTMALTEPEAGSSLGDLKTSAKADENSDSFLIKGQKMFISGGEHQLSENIIHLVLARIKGAPAGVKGISLFIVPKFLVDECGNIKEKNDVQLAGLIHKMGYRGTTSTVLNFGEKGHCQGFLIGEPNQGLKYMFMMMNEARIGVGLGAASIGYRGYLNSLAYARERTQGRLPSNRDASSPPLHLIEHADIRRMLLAQKAYVEGGMALCLYAAKLMDEAEASPNAKDRAEALQLLDLLTPVVKSFPSKYATKANDLAIQVLGGSGYTRDYPVEQCYRDNRLNPIHEGTEGIQALDLLGRKLWLNDSTAFGQLIKLIKATIALTDKDDNTLQPLSHLLSDSVDRLSKVTRKVAQSLGSQQAGTIDKTLANASLYLDSFSKVVVSWMWLQQASLAQQKLTLTDTDAHQRDFLQGKMQAAHYFIEWKLPTVHHDLMLVEQNNAVCFSMQGSWF